MNLRSPRLLMISLALGFGILLTWNIFQKLDEPGSLHDKKSERLPAPVEVATIEIASIEQIRSFTGTLQARAEFVVAPKVSGRLASLKVDLADSVERGQLVAVLDDAEYVQAVASAEADLALEQASHQEAHGLLQIAERELQRLSVIHQRGDISESQLDAARSQQLIKQAQTEVTQARIARAEADLETARIRLSYTQVRADWQEGSAQRVVAERFVDGGETLAANAPLLRIVELNPITAVLFVTERDYGLLQVGQAAAISSDAFPGESFHARVQRIAPVFSETTRQARVELEVDNPQLRLKPGMFARASISLQHVDHTTIVPQQALTTRDEQPGLFLVDGDHARWQAVEIGIQQGDRVQVSGANLSGQVVVLGQQLLEDGAALRIVTQAAK